MSNVKPWSLWPKQVKATHKSVCSSIWRHGVVYSRRSGSPSTMNLTRSRVHCHWLHKTLKKTFSEMRTVN
jgi:hypothetical protein